jgi:GPH family glycoside/pentoside/hexuronide:cation symporter
MSAPSPYQKLTLPQRVGLGFGGIPDLGMQYIIMTMSAQIFNVVWGVSPVLIGIAMSLPRLWEVIIDPWIGRLSDRTRGPLGRRHPYILAGGIIGGLFSAWVWWVPLDWSVTAKGYWLIAIALLHYTAFSFFMVPYSALLGEVTSDPIERTRLMAMRSVFTTICGTAMGWLYWICQRPVFGDVVHGIRIMGIFFGLAMAGAAIITTLVCPRSRDFHSHDKEVIHENQWAVLKEVFAVKEFRGLLLAVFCLMGSFGLGGNLGFYLSVFYVFRGDTKSAAWLGGIGAIVGCVTGLIGAPLVAYCAGKFGRWQTFRVFIILALVSCILGWWANRPQNPYATLYTGIIGGQGLTAFWIFMPALTGEISDRYEKRTGRSLYGSFFAFYGIAIKLSGSIALLFTGFLLNATGFTLKLGAGQSTTTFTIMRLVSVILPVMAFGLAYLCLKGVWRSMAEPETAAEEMAAEARLALSK